MKRIPLFLTPLLLAGCLIPVDTKVPTGTPGASQAPAAAANGLPAQLTYGGGPLSLGTAESRGLLPLIKDERGQIVAWPLTWSSTAANVATVDGGGTVKALAQGSATIVVALQANPAIKAQIPITVVTNRSSLGVTITPASPTIAIGDAPLQLLGQVQLADGQVNANVQWSSSDNTIATVNQTTGQINGLREGTVTIVGTYALDDTIRGQATVRVVAAGAAPTAQPSSVIFRPGGELGGQGAEAFAMNDGWTRDRITEKGLVNAIDFVDATTGFAVGDTGRILTTFDSGVSWQALNGRGLANQGANDVDFLDAQTGYLASGGYAIQRTRDGGQSWVPVGGNFENADGVRVGATQAVFLDANTGWVATGGAAAFKTTDAGENWGRVNTASLEFEAIAVGGGKLWLLSPGQVHSYADGAWSAAPAIATDTPVGGYMLARQVAFPTATDGWAAGTDANGLVVQRTNDGGRSWTRVAVKGADGASLLPGVRGASPVPVLGFADPRHGVVAHGDQAYVTTDGGFSWTHKDLAQHYVQQVRALDAKHFFLLAAPSSGGSRPSDPAYLLQFDGR